MQHRQYLQYFHQHACMFSCSVVSNSAALWTVAHQVPLSMGFSRQEYWSGSHALLQGILLTPGWNLHLCLLHWQVNSLPLVSLRDQPFSYFYFYAGETWAPVLLGLWDWCKGTVKNVPNKSNSVSSLTTNRCKVLLKLVQSAWSNYTQASEKEC